MITFVSSIHVLCCLFLVLFVLIQSGKGAEISASFGGSSQTVFGSSGGANLFAKITGGLAVVFMITSLFLTVHGSGESRSSVFDKLPVAPVSAPATSAQTPSNQMATPGVQPKPNTVDKAIMPGAADNVPAPAKK
jgi:preprotein translocase subunit SecG